MIIDKVKGLNLLPQDRLSHEMMEEAITEIHDKLSLLKDTYIPKGMHIFGRTPQGAGPGRAYVRRSCGTSRAPARSAPLFPT